ncbi:hypothetical protein [Pedobacter changchengzhani]|uniref:hypothetical protein n=1 Tax=Pedobacter changchengzhani TaxID=2529274 RepID=UPI0014054589|nr:hypothetical protein [Pedobacter changchengzhani]
MKTLTTTSPFLLLLVPVFMMIAITLSINLNQKADNDLVIKPAKTSTTLIKGATVLFK